MTKKVSKNTTGAARLPRGIRNNNPLNIRRSTSHWMGKVENPTDREFEQFAEMFFGIRAGMLLLTRYVVDYKLRTLKGIVHRWAPDGDGSNNERAYREALMQRGVTSDVQLTKEWLFGLMAAMCEVESQYALTRKTFEEAFAICTMAKQTWRAGV